MVANTFDAIIKNIAELMLYLNERKESIDNIIKFHNRIPKSKNKHENSSIDQLEGKY